MHDNIRKYETFISWSELLAKKPHPVILRAENDI